jgi:hypothetical protein
MNNNLQQKNVDIPLVWILTPRFLSSTSTINAGDRILNDGNGFLAHAILPLKSNSAATPPDVTQELALRKLNWNPNTINCKGQSS